MPRIRTLAAALVIAAILPALCYCAGTDKTASATTPTVTIHADKIAEPVSPYIYGQFIEHLGRCIYGGIWAEMLEDRKFYYPVPAEGPIWKEHKGARVLTASPWEVIGRNDGVKMVRENSFVGEHTPLIRPGSGICQRNLGVVKNKKYVGYVWLKPQNGETKIVVSLIWGDDPKQRGRKLIALQTNRYQKCRLNFTAGAATNQARLEITVDDAPCCVGAVSLMPADNIGGMRADTLKLLKELNAPIYRWPGGNFVSGYDWRDGIGDRDKRPPRKNPAWTGIEHNDFGLDEFIAFCREVAAEPLIVVNSGLGNHHSAAEEVQYANGSDETPMGKWRSQNGRPQSYNVKWWGIGNEMYGNWQLGYMSLERYVIKHNLFAKAMRNVDPSIKLIAVGDVGRWSEAMLKNCADNMDLISEHFYKGEKESVIEHVQQTSKAVISKVKAHRKWRNELDSLKGKDIRIALDEWNYWHRPYVYEYGELGCRYTLKDALGIAVGLHEMIRNSDMIAMANYAQTVNVIGCIKTTKTDAAFATTGLTLKLYRNHFGTLPVEVTGSAEPLDIVAAWTKDRKSLTVAVVNPTAHTYTIPISLKGAHWVPGSGMLSVIAGADPMAYNEPGKPPKVNITEIASCDGVLESLQVPPYSVSLCLMPAH